MRKHLTTLLVLISFFGSGQQPMLDTSYANNGYATGISNGSFGNYSVILPDDSIIMVGEANANTEFYLEKFLSDGTRDMNFGNNGFILHERMLNSKEKPYGVFLQSDGKILVTGIADVNPSLFGVYNNVFVARIMPDGQLDNSFGTNGYVTYDLGTNDDLAWDINMDSNGKIYVLGTLQTTNGLESRLLKFNNDGTLDTTFGNSGVLDLYFQTNTQITDVLINDLDELLVSGSVDRGNNELDAVIIKVNSTGVIDVTWGNSGVFTIPDAASTGTVADALLLSTGELIIAHLVLLNSTTREIRVSKILPSGVMDANFGVNGFSYFDPATSSASVFFPYDIKLLSDNNLLVVVDVVHNNNYDLHLFKLDHTGTLNSSFGSNGEFRINRSTHQDYNRNIQIESDDEVIITGMSTDNTTRFNTLTKILGTSTLSLNSSNVLPVIYPNPVENSLSINIPKEIKEITIYDLMSKEILTGVSTNELDVSSLEKGMYLIQIIDIQGNRFTEKIIKK